MQLVFGHDAAVADWVAARIPHVGYGEAFGPLAALGIARDGELIAGAVYHNYLAGYRVGELSFAASTPRWATRGNIRAVLHVPFEQYQWRRLTAVVAHDNVPVQKLLAGVGFKREGAVREMFASRPKVHGVIFGMLSREYDAMIKRFR
jgi:RimJ/RimL family protein N-acetyltransferase